MAITTIIDNLFCKPDCFLSLHELTIMKRAIAPNSHESRYPHRPSFSMYVSAYSVKDSTFSSMMSSTQFSMAKIAHAPIKTTPIIGMRRDVKMIGKYSTVSIDDGCIMVFSANKMIAYIHFRLYNNAKINRPIAMAKLCLIVLNVLK